MKKTVMFLLLTCFASTLAAQDSAEKIMEKRAREMHRVITLNDKEQWKTFIRENYSQALIDKPMRAAVQTDDNGTVASSQADQAKESDNVEKKAMMFSQLHDDFGDSKISSLEIKAETVIVKLKSPSSGMPGTITLRFSKTKPYLVEGLGIEAGN